MAIPSIYTLYMNEWKYEWKNYHLSIWTIYAWKPNKETNAFELATTLGGHNCAVVSLTVGGGRLYYGSLKYAVNVIWLNDSL